jgi:hypothetical protein
MTTKSQNKLNYEEVDVRVTAFDEWLAGQEQPVKDTVCQHIGALTNAVPTMGEKSAKLLLAEVYLLARRHIHIEKKYGEREK